MASFAYFVQLQLKSPIRIECEKKTRTQNSKSYDMKDIYIRHNSMPQHTRRPRSAACPEPEHLPLRANEHKCTTHTHTYLQILQRTESTLARGHRCRLNNNIIVITSDVDVRQHRCRQPALFRFDFDRICCYAGHFVYLLVGSR